MHRRSTRALVLALAALALAPAAGAQSPTDPVEAPVVVDVASPEGPIRPLSGIASLDVTVRVACHLLVNAPQDATPVQLAVEGPTWTTLTVTPATLMLPSTCVPGTYEAGEASVLVATTTAAHAFTPSEIVVTATVETASDPVSGEGRTEVEADFFSVMDAALDNPLPRTRAGQPAEVNVRVTNLGNADTRVTLHLVDAPPGWDVTHGEPVVVGSHHAAPDGNIADIPVTITPPAGTKADQGIVTLRATTAYAHGDAEDGDMVPLSVLVNVDRGGLLAAGDGDRAVPATAPAVALAGVALAAAAGATRVRRA